MYFVASGSSIKIGEAADPYERMRDFHTGNPHGLELLHVIAKDSKYARQRLEDQLHLRFNYLPLAGPSRMVPESSRADGVHRLHLLRGVLPVTGDHGATALPTGRAAVTACERFADTR